MSIQVIVLDDSLGAAKTFATLIADETALETFATNSPDEAKEVVRNNDVKVVVLDQVLDEISPPTTGSAVFEEIKRIEPGIRGIMFSGRAREPDFREAMRLKFADFVDKNEVARLPDVVREQYQQRLGAIAEEHLASAKVLKTIRSKRSLLRPRVTIELLGLDDATSAGEPVRGKWKVVDRMTAE